MKSDRSSEDKIEQYLLGKLSPAENLEVEKAMREQAGFALEVELRRLEFDTSEELIARDIRAQFRRLREQAPEPGTTFPLKSRRWYYYAAAASLALVIFLFYRYSDEKQKVALPHTPIPDTSIQSPNPHIPVMQGDAPLQKPQQTTVPKSRQDQRHIAMAKDYYNKSWDKNEISTIRGNEAPGPQNAVDRAVLSWQRGAYREMLQSLDTIRASHPRFYTAQLFRAHAYFNLGKYKDAAAAARTVADWKGNAAYSEKAEWLLVLSLVADGRSGTDEFRTVSDKMLKDEGHSFHNDMIALRDELSTLPKNSRQ